MSKKILHRRTRKKPVKELSIWEQARKMQEEDEYIRDEYYDRAAKVLPKRLYMCFRNNKLNQTNVLLLGILEKLSRKKK